MVKVIFVFVLLLAIAQGQNLPDPKTILASLPQHVQTVIIKSKQLDRLIALYQQALATEVASLSGNVVATLQALSSSAAANIATLTASLQTLQSEAKDALTDLAAKLADSLGKNQGFSTLVSQFGDVRAALQIECEDLKNISAIAVASLKEIAVGKINASILEQQLYLSANWLSLATDTAARDAFIQQVVALRATSKVAGQLVPLVQSFIANNSAAIDKCVSAVQDKAAALALGVKNAYDEVKAIVVADVQQFKERVSVIAQHVMGENAATIQDVKYLIDEIKKQVEVTVQVSIKDIVAASDDIIKQTLKAALEAITLGEAEVSKVTGGKRQTGNLASFVVTLSGSADLLSSVGASTDLKTALQALQNDPAVQAKLAELQNLSSEQIVALLSATLAELQNATKLSDAANSLWQQKVADFLDKAASAKKAITSAVASEKDKLTAVLQAQQAFIDAKEKELASELSQLQAKVPAINAEIQQIQQKLAIVVSQLANSGSLSASALTTLKSLNASLSEAIKAKILELVAAKQKLADALKTSYAQAVQQITAYKADVAAKLQLAVQAELNATIAEIQKRVAEHSDEIKQRISDIVRAIQSDVAGVTTVLQNIPEGSKLVHTILYDDAKTSLEDVLATLKSVIQAEFNTQKVTVAVKAGTKRSAQTVTVESTVASADNSQASNNSNSGSGALTTGALVGIIVGVVVVVVIVVVLAIVLKKQRDDDYQSMLA